MLYKGSHAKYDWRDIVIGDEYQIRQYPINYFDYIIDIGANVGIFSILARVLNPSIDVKIFAIEPDPDIYGKYLIPNLDNLYITTCKYALGDGQDMFLDNSLPALTAHMCNKVDINKTNIKVETKTLSQLITEFGIDMGKKVMIKIDCEGGEQFLLNKESMNILTKAQHIALELHFPASGYRNPQFKNLPTYQIYMKWIAKYFKEFDMDYTSGSRRMGHGNCILRRKN